MTFAYDTSFATDKDKLRLAIDDVDANAYFFDDEVLTYILSDEESFGAAVVACLEKIVMRLSRPDFSTDWVAVKNQPAREGYEKALARAAAKYGLSPSNVTITTAIVQPYRVDSLQDADTDYTG